MKPALEPWTRLAAWEGAKIGRHDHARDTFQETRSATRRLLLKSTSSVPQSTPFTDFLSVAYSRIHSSPNFMPLVRSQEDEFHHIESGLRATSIEKWRVSTPHSQHSSDLRSSLKPPSWNPRFPSKTASWPTAAQHVVRLERIQEDEDDDDYPTPQPGPPQIPMEVTVSDYMYIMS
jgi:hypothetical protein